KQYWDAPRWIRITDDENSMRWVGLNQPQTMLDIARERLGDDPQAEAKLALLAQDPMAQQVVNIKNSVAELDVDIVIDEGMDTPTVQAEQFDTLMKMMPSMTQLPPQALELLIQASSLRDKDKLMGIVKKMQEPAPEAMQKQQIQEQLALQAATSNIEKTQSETQKNIADAEAKKVNSGVDLMQAQANALSNAQNMGMVI
ncbi:MAG: hypothetical protein KGM99_05635, partial [Burkholderiales bacterium]|nr:hypothetical protein [Burkholderiales bacterium]